MSAEPEKFDKLQQLLKLKRHEQPPPGYFKDFSNQVISNIQAGGKEHSPTVMEWLSMEAPWLHRMVSAFETRPVTAISFGAMACALVIGTIMFTQNMGYTPLTLTSTQANNTNTAVVATTGILGNSSTAPLSLADNTNRPIITTPGGSLFDQFSIDPNKVQPAGYKPQGE